MNTSNFSCFRVVELSCQIQKSDFFEVRGRSKPINPDAEPMRSSLLQIWRLREAGLPTEFFSLWWPVDFLRGFDIDFGAFSVEISVSSCTFIK